MHKERSTSEKVDYNEQFLWHLFIFEFVMFTDSKLNSMKKVMVDLKELAQCTFQPNHLDALADLQSKIFDARWPLPYSIFYITMQFSESFAVMMYLLLPLRLPPREILDLLGGVNISVSKRRSPVFGRSLTK